MAPAKPTVAVNLATDFETSSKHATESQSTMPRTALPAVRKAWLWEIVSLVLAVAFLGIVCLLLWTSDSFPFRELPLQIKLTTALSILANVIEALVAVPLAAGLGQIMWIRYHQGHQSLNDITMFDSASRGPLGELSLLVRQHKSAKAYFGATVGLLALGIGPLLQETLTYVSVNGQTSLPRCEATSFFTGQVIYNTYHGIIISDDIQSGGIADQGLQELEADCSTGNCTFPIFTSLGICSSCGNITDLLNQTCATTSEFETDPICKATFTDDDGSTIWIDNTTVLNSVEYDSGIPRLETYGDSAILALRMLRYDQVEVAHATECAFYYCVRAYQAAVRDHILEQNVTAIWYGTNASIDEQQGIVFSPPPAAWESLNLTQATNFTIDVETWGQIPTWLGVRGTVMSEDGATSTNNSDDLIRHLYDNLHAPNASQDVGGLFADVTMEMSDKMRQLCPANISVHGIVFDVSTILKVQWQWVTFPALVIALTGVFLLWVILDSYRNHAMAWKNSVLPFIFYGRSADVDRLVNEERVEDVEDMEVYANSLKVKLERDERGVWHFGRLRLWHSDAEVDSRSTLHH